MAVGDHLGFASLIVSLLAIGIAILWSSKKSIGYSAIALAIVLCGYWIFRSTRPHLSPPNRVASQTSRSDKSSTSGEQPRETPITGAKAHARSRPIRPTASVKGSDNTLYGDTGNRTVDGNGNTIVGATDSNGNTVLNHGGVAIGKGASADPTSIAIGAGAHAGNTQPTVQNK